MFGRQMVIGIAGLHLAKMLDRQMANSISKDREKTDLTIILLLWKYLVEL